MTKASVRNEASAFEAPLKAAARERVPAWTTNTQVTEAIAANNLRKVYRGEAGRPPLEALKGIDLCVPRGSFFGLLGPNGAGKSTFINVLAGLAIKTSGRVSIWGHDIDEEPRRARAAIGVVPQELNLDPFFTPAEVLEFQAGLYGVPRRERRTSEILSVLHLSAQSKAYARTLSGGMRRRLLIGKALVHDPPVVILDEPTAGVDIELRHQLWDYMRRLNARGTTIVLTTHYLEEAEELCDRIAIIDKGELVACDTTPALVRLIDEKTLLITPEHALTAVPADLEEFRAELKPEGALALHYRPSAVGIETMLARVRACGIAIRDLSTIESDLEDIFVQLIRSR